MKKRFSAPLAVAALAAAFPSAASTESTKTDQPKLQVASANTVEEIVITASGTEQELFKSTVTIDTVSAEDSEFDRATWIGETVNRMPGVYMLKYRGPVDAPAIRLPVSTDNVYLFLQDSVPLQSPISFNHAAFAYSGALTSPGGMEILKGPGTAIHGSDALAAVVNVKSQAPSFEREGLVSYRGGENNLQDIRLDVTGGLNESNAARLAVSYQSDDGWRDTSDWERTQVIARHLFQSDGWEVNNIVSYTDFDSGMSTSLRPDVLENDPTSDGLDDAVDRDEARSQTEYFRFSSQISKSLSDNVSVQITPYLRTIDAQYLTTWEPATTPVTATETDTFGLLNRLYLDWNENSSTIVGLDYEGTEFYRNTRQTRPTQVVWGTVYPQGTQLDYEVSYQSLAPYIQHTQSLTDKLTLVLGLRYENSEYSYSNNLTEADFTAEEPSPYLIMTTRDDSFSELLPKASLSYAISDRHSVYARYAKGFRIPDEGDLYVLSPSQAEFELDPETIQSYEVGYRGWLSDTFSINAAIYHMVAEGGIVTGVSTPAGNISVNGGEEQYQGIELGFEAQLGSDVRLTVAAATTDNTVKQKFSDEPSDLDGKTLTNSPDPIVNVRLRYQPTALDALTTELEVQYTGSWYMDEANRTQTDGETVLNLRADYALMESLVIDLKIQNLLNEEYYATADAPTWAPEGRYRPGDPRTVSAGITYRF